MNTPNALDLCRAYVKSSANPETNLKSRVKPDGPVVTISRAAGARGNSIAAELAEQLESNQTIPKYHPWTVFNQNLIQHVIDEHQLPGTTAAYSTEDKPDEIQAIIGEMLGLHPGTFNIAAKTAETILRLAKTGNALIVGRGANIITEGIAHALHVRLIGSPDARIRYFAKHYSLTEKQAAAEIARLDKGRKLYLKTNFHRDVDDPLLYDLTLNTDSFSNSQAARIIVSALEEKLR